MTKKGNILFDTFMTFQHSKPTHKKSRSVLININIFDNKQPCRSRYHTMVWISQTDLPMWKSKHCETIIEINEVQMVNKSKIQR